MAAVSRLFVTGASGTLGGPLTQRAVAAGWDVLACYYTNPAGVRAGTPIRLDLRDRAAVRETVEHFRPDVIIHGAVTERSGPGYEDAIRLAAQHVAEAAASTDARLIALSTDLVFDGTAPLYREDSPPRPAARSSYGRAKADAEAIVQAACPAALIVRTSLIYDFDPANAQAAWMLRAIEAGELARLYADQIRCPIWAVNLADALLALAGTDARGLLHVVGPEPCSRYALGCALLDALGIDAAAHVVAVDAPEWQPRSLVLSIDRARALLPQVPLLTLAAARASWSAARPRPSA